MEAVGANSQVIVTGFMSFPGNRKVLTFSRFPTCVFSRWRCQRKASVRLEEKYRLEFSDTVFNSTRETLGHT